MEENNLTHDEAQKPLEFTKLIRSELKQTAKWAGRYAWFYLAFFSLFMLIAIVASCVGPFQFGGYPFRALVLLVIVVTVMLLPIFFLFRFSKNTKRALANSDQGAMEDAFYQMQRFWHLMWIYLMVGVALYAILLLLTIAIAGLKGLSGSGIGT